MKLADVRRAFARQMLTIAGASEDKRLEDAFARVPREKFLGPGRWHILTPWAAQTYVDRDPALVYQDVVIALDEQRGVNNGSPSLHAQWMHRVAPREGESVTHIGAGTGYYSAILSELVGASGHVTAVEYDEASAARARENLSDRENLDVVQGDGCEWPRDETDIVYVNFAVPRPASPWIEKLCPGGRLIFPLGLPRTTHVGGRTMNSIAFLIMRRDNGFSARATSGVSFIFAEGRAAELPQIEFKALQKSLKRGGWDGVRSLIWKRPVEERACWYIGPGWALSFEDVAP